MSKNKICKFWVKISPRSHQSESLGWEENFLKIKIAALASQGEANEELIEFLSKKLNVSKSRVHIQKGHTSKIKQIQVDGISLNELKHIF